MLRRIWWLFAIDAAIYVINAFTFSSATSKLATAADAFLIFSFLAVSFAAFFAARHSGRIVDGVKMGAMFWFIWRPMLFVVSGALSIATGSVDYSNAPMAALGYILAQLLVSPIVFVLCVGAGWLGGKLKRIEQ